MKERKIKESKIRDRFVKLKSSLNERARRLFVANEAIAFGYGGIAAASRATGMAASVIGRGIAAHRQRLRTPVLDRPHLRDPPSDDTRCHPRGARGRRNTAIAEGDRLVRNRFKGSEYSKRHGS